jgi:NAD(P)H dehydrogenase (quinone)
VSSTSSPTPSTDWPVTRRRPPGNGFAPIRTRTPDFARDDICDVTARALVDAPPDEVYDVTGPAALTIGETVALLSDVTGREITYVDEGLDEARAARRAAYDAQDFEIEGWITTYAAVAAGELGPVTDTVDRLAGHPATPAGEWLRAHPDAYARLRP